MASGNRKSSRAKPPLTRHPLFPAIVALWFGALFGLGSLAIRPSVLEAAVVASGIDLVVSAAAPPLGVTARILLALAMALVGGLVGITIGLRLGRVKAAPPQRRRTTLSSENPAPPRRADAFAPATEATPRRPLSVFDEMPDGEQIEPEDYDASPAPRRRQLALEESSEPDYARTFAPLPGGELGQTDLDVLDLAVALRAEEPEPMPFTAETHVPETPAYFSSPAETAPSLRQFGAPAPADAMAQPAAIEAPALMRRFDAVTAQSSLEAESDEDDRGLPARNLGGRFAAPAAAPEIPEPPVMEAPDAPAVPTAYEPQVEPEPAPAPEPAPLSRPTGSAAAKLRSASLETLSQLELIERLALSMQQRREAAAKIEAAPAPEPMAPPAAAGMDVPRFGFEPKEPIEIDLPLATAQLAPPVPTIPPALRPLGLDFAGPEEDSAPVFARPTMPAAMRPISLDFDDEAEDDAAPNTRFAFSKPIGAMQREAMEPEATSDPDEGYSSLLELGQAPLRAPLVRIEEPADASDEIEPVVVFPGHASRPFAAPGPAAAVPAQPIEAAEPLEPGIRRFDAPAEAGAPGQPAGARVDPEETERALRAALATLQRMSGAA